MTTAAPVDHTPNRPFPRADEGVAPAASDRLLDRRRAERMRRHRRRRWSRVARSALTAASWTVVALAALVCLAGLLLPSGR